MTFKAFTTSLAGTTPPEGLPDLLQALWHDARGDWTKAHQIAQDVNGRDAAWVHAYLHRKEGDLSNASYWYHQAGHTLPQNSLQEEWEFIVQKLLD